MRMVGILPRRPTFTSCGAGPPVKMGRHGIVLAQYDASCSKALVCRLEWEHEFTVGVVR